MTDAAELLHCPFCGSKNIDPEGWASTDRAGPACDDCGGTADTVELWNTRPLAAQQDGAWQPIETAPKDTFLILGWWETWRGEPKWVWEANKAADTYGRWLHGRATHWMPAPCAPEQ